MKFGYCYSVAATSKAYGVTQAHSCSSRQHTTTVVVAKMKKREKKKAEWHLFFRLFLVLPAVGSYNDTHTHTLTNPHTEATLVAVTKGTG